MRDFCIKPAIFDLFRIEYFTLKENGESDIRYTDLPNLLDRTPGDVVTGHYLQKFLWKYDEEGR